MNKCYLYNCTRRTLKNQVPFSSRHRCNDWARTHWACMPLVLLVQPLISNMLIILVWLANAFESVEKDKFRFVSIIFFAPCFLKLPALLLMRHKGGIIFVQSFEQKSYFLSIYCNIWSDIFSENAIILDLTLFKRLTKFRKRIINDSWIHLCYT